jgi:hypothetical protein
LGTFFYNRHNDSNSASANSLLVPLWSLFEIRPSGYVFWHASKDVWKVNKVILGSMLSLLLGAATCSGQIIFESDLVPIVVDSGAVVNALITVTNQGDRDQKVHFALDYRRRGHCKQEVEEWAEVIPARIDLKKGERRSIAIRVSGLKFKTQTECVLGLFAAVEQDGLIPLELRYGIPVFVCFNGRENIRGKILKANSSADAGKIHLDILIRNTGGVHLLPYGLVWTENAQGQREWQAELRFNQPVYSGDTRTLAWDGARAKEFSHKEKIRIQLFWGTLYDLKRVGMPRNEIHLGNIKLSKASR